MMKNKIEKKKLTSIKTWPEDDEQRKNLPKKGAKESISASFVKDISHLTSSLKAMEAQAKKMGIFLCERELLQCKCGFVEDVACDGRLITYKKGDKIKDTGLRFRKTSGNKYVCPVCKSTVTETAFV